MADRTLLQHELQGITRERMLREFAEVVGTLTVQTPLLLVLEDLYWSDYATLDLLTFLARRRTPARLLLLGTYRPGDTMVQELRQHGYGTEFPLSLLSQSGVAQYLATRFPGHTFPDTITAWLSQHTDSAAISPARVPYARSLYAPICWWRCRRRTPMTRCATTV